MEQRIDFYKSGRSEILMRSGVLGIGSESQAI